MRRVGRDGRGASAGQTMGNGPWSVHGPHRLGTVCGRPVSSSPSCKGPNTLKEMNKSETMRYDSDTMRTGLLYCDGLVKTELDETDTPDRIAPSRFIRTAFV